MNKLTKAVASQMGYNKQDEEFLDSMQDVSSRGADAGFPGFTYYTDTSAFFKQHQHLIVNHCKNEAEAYGMDAVSFVASFNCLEDDRETRDEIGRCLYGQPSEGDFLVANALSWFALEETARFVIDQ